MEVIHFTRDDLVGNHAGETEITTILLLEANREKVIHIDLVPRDDKDLYAYESLGAIDDFRREYPDTVVILNRGNNTFPDEENVEGEIKEEVKESFPPNSIPPEDDIMHVMMREMEKICSLNSLQDTTTPEELEQCRKMITNSLEKHHEFARDIDVEALTGSYREQYETLTSKHTPQEKEAFTFEVYESIVKSTRKILTHIKDSFQ